MTAATAFPAYGDPDVLEAIDVEKPQPGGDAYRTVKVAEEPD